MFRRCPVEIDRLDLATPIDATVPSLLRTTLVAMQSDAV
jgi:hypothetical protein